MEMIMIVSEDRHLKLTGEKIMDRQWDLAVCGQGFAYGYLLLMKAHTTGLEFAVCSPYWRSNSPQNFQMGKLSRLWELAHRNVDIPVKATLCDFARSTAIIELWWWNAHRMINFSFCLFLLCLSMSKSRDHLAFCVRKSNFASTSERSALKIC